MSQGLEQIKDTLARITRGDNAMDLLMEFERTLDKTEVFAYKNWLLGELVKGPEVKKYWFVTSWMWPHELMPDPDGALRLEKIGCKVLYTKDTLDQPRRVLSPKDWQNLRTKEAIIDELPVWVVEIQMPIKYVTDSLDVLHDFIDDEVAASVDAVADAVAPEDDMGDDELGGDDDFDLSGDDEELKL